MRKQNCTHIGIDKKLENIIGPMWLVTTITGQILSNMHWQLSKIDSLIKYKKVYNLYKIFSKIKNVEITKKLINQDQTY